MKIILTENQIEFIRRYKKIKELVDEGIDVLSNDEDFCGFNYSAFIEEVCWQVSDKMEHLNLPTDTVGMIENVHKWVTDNFDEYIRKEFDRVIVDNPNCDEGYDDADDEEYNLQESYEDKEYDTSLRNALLRRHNVIMSEMDHYMTNNLACDEFPDDVEGFKDYILEEVADVMMFTHNVNNWEWHDVYLSLEDMIGKQIKKTFKSWTKKHC
jgi:hypothetical protein